MNKSFLSFSFMALFLSTISSCNTLHASSLKEKTTSDFFVSQVTPQGLLSSSVKFPSIQILFSKAVIPLAKLGEVSSLSDAVKIEPELDGVFRWYGTSILSFDASDEMIPQKEYKITVNKNLKSIDGEKISGPLEFTFRTEDIKITFLEAGYSADKKNKSYINNDDVPLEYAKNFALNFSNKVNAQNISKFISISDSKGKKYNFRASQLSDQKILIELKENLPADSQIKISLKKGAKAFEDSAGTLKEQSISFHTLRPFEAKDFYEGSTVKIIFNHRIKSGQEDAIFSALSTSLKSPLKKEQVEVKGKSIIIKDLDVKYGESFSVKIRKNSFKDIYGQSCKKNISKKIKVGKASSFIYFDYGRDYVLESSFPAKRAFAFQNYSGKAKYTISPLCGVSENFKLPDFFTNDVKTKEAKINRKIIQTIDLCPYLEKVSTSSGSQWRGAVKLTTFSKDTSKGKERVNTSIIQVTDMALTVHSSWNKSLVLVTNISDGKIIKDADVKIFAASSLEDAIVNKSFVEEKNILAWAKTNAKGLACLDFSYDADREENKSKRLYVEVKTADDRLVQELYSVGNSLYLKDCKDISNKEELFQNEDFLKIYKTNVTNIFSDSSLYKAGESAHFKIIDRDLRAGHYSLYTGDYEINITEECYWKKNHVIYETFKGQLSAQGTCSVEWKIPENLKPGTYYLEYKRENKKKYYSFQIQSFEKLKFSASASIAQVPYYSGENICANVSANYLDGAALNGASLESFWTRSRSQFTINDSQHDDWTFGPYNFFWDYNPQDYDFYIKEKSLLDENGKCSLQVKSGGEKEEGIPYTYFLEGQITESSNQIIAAKAQVTVHPAYFYIGLSPYKSENVFPSTGQEISFDYALFTPEGKSVEENKLNKDKKISYRLIHSFYREEISEDEFGIENSDWVEAEEVEVQKDLEISASQNGSVTIKTKSSGNYIIEFTSIDSQGRKVISSKSFYVRENSFDLKNHYDQNLELSADKKEYKAGEKANLLLKSPLEKGTYLLTVEREGILKEEILNLKEQCSLIELQIEKGWSPCVNVTVSTFQNRNENPPSQYGKEDEGIAKSLFAEIRLSINPCENEFTIDVQGNKKFYKPGERVSLDIFAHQNSKALKDAEICIMIMDRGLLDLTAYRAPSPVNTFYNQALFQSSTVHEDSRKNLSYPVTYEAYDESPEIEIEYYRPRLLSKMMGLTTASTDMAAESFALEEESANMVTSSFVQEKENGQKDSTYQIRKNFLSCAVFIPDIKTDSNGKASFSFTLPDSLTEYIVTVIGIKENSYAYTEDSLKATNPISVRDACTRILRPGDLGEEGITITNNSSAKEKVNVDFSIINEKGKALLLSEKNQNVTVNPGETKNIFFNIKALQEGKIKFEFKITSDSLKEILCKEIQIEKSYIFESVTSMGQMTDEEKFIQEKIIFPSLNDDDNLSFYIQVDSTRLGTLSSAIDYVFHYPYGCLEQRSSAILPLIVFADYIDVFNLESQVQDPKETVEKEIAQWATYQKSDGSYPYWKDDSEGSLAVSLRIAEILCIAKNHNLDTGKNNLDKLASHLQSQAKKIKKDGNLYPLAYTNYLLTLLKKNISKADLNEIIKKSSSVSQLAYAGLAAVNMNYREVAESACVKIKNLMSLTNQGVSFQNSYNPSCWFFYNTRSEDFALALMLFSKLDKNDIYNQHIVNQLLLLQKAGQGKWKSTAETARVLIALEEFISQNDFKESNLKAEIFLDDKNILRENFSLNEKQEASAKLDYKNLKEKNISLGKEIPLEIKKDGKGPLFYTARLKYALPAEEQIAKDQGICIYSEIMNAKTGQLVKEDQLEIGQIYKEKIFITSNKARTFLALRASIPAGCEIINSTFATSISIPENVEEESNFSKDDFYYNSLSRQDIYDAEIRCFWNYFPMGSQSFEFTFRPIRKGKYQTPSVLAECMYEEEIFGRSQGKVWEIKDGY